MRGTEAVYPYRVHSLADYHPRKAIHKESARWLLHVAGKFCLWPRRKTLKRALDGIMSAIIALERSLCMEVRYGQIDGVISIRVVVDEPTKLMLLEKEYAHATKPRGHL